MKTSIFPFLAVAVSLAASQALADVITTRTRTSPFVVGDNESCKTPIFVPLNDAGAIAASFNVPTAGTIVITYNAECQVLRGYAESTLRWLNIDILVDGFAAAPTNSDNALCSARYLSHINYVAATTMAVRNVAAGQHNVRVRSNLVDCFDSANDRYLLDDSVLMIQR